MRVAGSFFLQLQGAIDGQQPLAAEEEGAEAATPKEQAAAIERRLKLVEAGLIELQLCQLNLQLYRQRIISAQQDRRIEQLESQVQDLRRDSEQRAALEAPRQ